MKISTKGRYALRMLIDLIQHREDGFISLNDIAKRQNISKQYLEQIVSLLNTSNILRTNRGKLGGYMLARAPSDFTVKDILRITEGSLAPVACLEEEVNQCEKAPYCQTLPMWQELQKVISDYLESVTLQDLYEKGKVNPENWVI